VRHNCIPLAVIMRAEPKFVMRGSKIKIKIKIFKGKNSILGVEFIKKKHLKEFFKNLETFNNFGGRVRSSTPTVMIILT
jgi:hypothetical protein